VVDHYGIAVIGRTKSNIKFKISKKSSKGIDADLYVLPEDAYGGDHEDNQCFNTQDYKAVKGLQNISPCQYGTT
jgi:hypothetical protein